MAAKVPHSCSSGGYAHPPGCSCGRPDCPVPPDVTDKWEQMREECYTPSPLRPVGSRARMRE